MPKENEQGHYLGPEDYTIDDYLVTIKDMLAQSVSNNNYLDMSLPDIGKLLKDLVGYTNIVKKKADKLTEDMKDTKNKLDNKDEQEVFLQSKYDILLLIFILG